SAVRLRAPRPGAATTGRPSRDQQGNGLRAIFGRARLVLLPGQSPQFVRRPLVQTRQRPVRPRPALVGIDGPLALEGPRERLDRLLVITLVHVELPDQERQVGGGTVRDLLGIGRGFLLVHVSVLGRAFTHPLRYPRQPAPRCALRDLPDLDLVPPVVAEIKPI